MTEFPDKQSELEYLQWQKEELTKDIETFESTITEPQATSAPARMQKYGMQEGQSMMNVAAGLSPWAFNHPASLVHPAILAGADDISLKAERSDETMTMESPWYSLAEDINRAVEEPAPEVEQEYPSFGAELIDETPLMDRLFAEAADAITSRVQETVKEPEPQER